MNKKEFKALDADAQYEAYKAAEKSAADAEKLVVELNTALATAEKSATEEVPTVTVEKTQYTVIGNIRVPKDKVEEIGKPIISGRELAKFPALAAQLVKERSGQLVEVEPTEKEK